MYCLLILVFWFVSYCFICYSYCSSCVGPAFGSFLSVVKSVHCEGSRSLTSDHQHWIPPRTRLSPLLFSLSTNNTRTQAPSPIIIKIIFIVITRTHNEIYIWNTWLIESLEWKQYVNVRTQQWWVKVVCARVHEDEQALSLSVWPGGNVCFCASLKDTLI